MSLNDRQAARQWALGDVVVTLVVVSLFFERIDYVLYLEHGFPIPNPIFVLAGLLVLAYAAALGYRRELDLRAPSWAELTVVGLIIVLGLTSVAAALAADRPTAEFSNAIQTQAPVLRGASHCEQATCKRRGTPATLRSRAVQIDGKSHSSAFYVQLSTKSKKPAQASVVLEQRSPTREATPSTATERVTIPPSGESVQVLVTVKVPARGTHWLTASIIHPRGVTVSAVNPELRTIRPAEFVRHFGQSVKTFAHFAYFAVIVL